MERRRRRIAETFVASDEPGGDPSQSNCDSERACGVSLDMDSGQPLTAILQVSPPVLPTSIFQSSRAAFPRLKKDCVG